MEMLIAFLIGGAVAGTTLYSGYLLGRRTRLKVEQRIVPPTTVKEIQDERATNAIRDNFFAGDRDWWREVLSRVNSFLKFKFGSTVRKLEDEVARELVESMVRPFAYGADEVDVPGFLGLKLSAVTLLGDPELEDGKNGQYTEPPTVTEFTSPVCKPD